MKRTKISCAMCDLKNHAKVPAQMPDKPIVAIYRFSPDVNDVREMKPFAGGMGKVIAWAVNEAGLRMENCFLGNVISCKLDDGLEDIQKSDARNFCRGGLIEELTELHNRGCTTVVALGIDTALSFGIDGKLGSNRGSVFKYTFLNKTFHIIPSYSPEELCASHWKKDGGGSGSNAVAWIADFKKAVDIAQNGWKDLKENFILEPKISDVRAFIRKALADKSLIAVDTETTSLDKQKAKIVVCGIATSEENALSIPFLTTHGYPYWHPVEEIEVKALLKELLLKNNQIYQNCFYDIPILMRHGFEFDLSKIEDTLLIHHTLSPESEHNLGFITSIYGKTPYWKAEFLGRTKSILEIDQVEMRRYNLRDCVVLHQIRDAMYKDMIELGVLDFYNEEPRQLIAPLMEMSEAGIEFDEKGLKKFATEVKTARDKVETELRTLGNLPPEFNFGSDSELRYFLFGEVPNTFAKISEISLLQSRIAQYHEDIHTLVEEQNALSVTIRANGDEMPPKDRTKLERKYDKIELLLHKKYEQIKRAGSTKKYQALSRLATVRDKVKPIYVLKNYRPLQTDGGFSSVDAEGLLSYRIQLNNRLRDVKAFAKPDETEIAQIEKLLAWLSEWAQYSTYDKLVTTYTRYEPDSDGRIRPNWKAHGTATGRLSCIAKGERILTSRGMIPIENIQVGDKVQTHLGQSSEVSAIICNGVLPVYRLTLSTGQSIICTSDHEFFTPNGWTRADNLTEAYYVDSEAYLRRLSSGEEGSLVVPRGYEETRVGGYCIGSWFNPTQCLLHYSLNCPRRQKEIRAGFEKISVKIWEKLSYVWTDWFKASKLERNMFRQQRALYRNNEWETLFPASNCVCQSSGYSSESAFPFTDSASHRREPGKQLIGQPCSLYKCWTSKTTPKVATVTSFELVGEMEVYDLSIRGVHSFITESGFLAHNCSAPNLMNLPNSKHAESDDPFTEIIRNLFRSKPGYSLISCDFVNLEVYILAFETLDPELLKVVNEHANIHDLNTKALFGIEETDPNWKQMRGAAKIYQFGRLQYGGGDAGVFRKVMLACPKITMTLREFSEASARWMSLHPAYVEWYTAIQKEVTETRKIKTAFGRLRVFLGNDEGLVREALSTKIQSAGASVVNRSMSRIYKEKSQRNLDAKFVLQIHDQLVMEVRDDQIEEVKEIMVRQMETPFKFKGFDRVINVDPTVGKTLGEL